MDKVYFSAFNRMDDGFEAIIIKRILGIDDKLYVEIEKAY